MERIIFHIDVNSAYLSWSALKLLEENPDAQDIRSLPSIIGGDQSQRRGVVLAKSIPAKKYQIKTGEPIVNALRKYPNLLIVSPDHQLYRRKSNELMNYLHALTPDIEQVSIDECYLDFTGISHLYPSPEEAARQIRETVREQFGFTVNVGISTNKLLAKMASDFEKPDKTHTLYPEEIPRKMWPLPINDLFMAGHSSVETLAKLDIHTIGDLANTNPDILILHLKSHGRLLWEYANGIDETPVTSEPAKAKGIGNSTTLAADVTDGNEAKKILHQLCEKVAQRLRSEPVMAASLCVEIKYNNFERVSHQTQLPSPSWSGNELYDQACLLFDALWDKTPIRLLGIRAGKLVSPDTPVQMSIFDYTPQDTRSTQLQKEKQHRLDAALDKIRLKYGKDSVKRGF